MFHSSSGLCRSALFLSNIERAAIKLGIISGFLFAAFEIGRLYLPTGIEFIDRPPQSL